MVHDFEIVFGLDGSPMGNGSPRLCQPRSDCLVLVVAVVDSWSECPALVASDCWLNGGDIWLPVCLPLREVCTVFPSGERMVAIHVGGHWHGAILLPEGLLSNLRSRCLLVLLPPLESPKSGALLHVVLLSTAPSLRHGVVVRGNIIAVDVTEPATLMTQEPNDPGRLGVVL